MAVTLPSGGRFAGGVEVPVLEPELADGWSGLWSTGDCGCGGAALEDGWSGMWPASSSSSSGAFVGGCGCERPALDDGWSGSPTARTSSGAGGRTGGGSSFAGIVPIEGGGFDPRWTLSIPLSAVGEAAGLGVKGTPETTVGTNSDPTSGSYVPPESAGNTEGADVNTFVDALAAEVTPQFAGLLDATTWADTVGGCPTGDAETCGDPRFDRGQLVAAEQGIVGASLLPAIDRSLRGEWTDCERAVVQAAWMLLADNLDLVRWAVCAAANDVTSGDCVEDFVMCRSPVHVRKRDCASDTLQGDSVPAGTPLELVAAGVGTFLLSGPPEIFASLLGELAIPRITLCTTDTWVFARSAELYCSDDPNAADCGIITLAALLLHEMTHLCFRALEDNWDRVCAVSYLTGGYFAYGALARFPRADQSACCQNSVRVPGLDNMDGDVLPRIPATCLGRDDPETLVY